MKKSLLHSKVLTLRHRGFGINEISRKLRIRKNTVSDWCYKLQLTEKQKECLRKRSKERALLNHHKAMVLRRRVNLDKRLLIETEEAGKIGELNGRELFLTGVALYWAEGFKNLRAGTLGFSNSDPNLIKFYLHWLRRSLGVRPADISFRLTVNSAFRKRVKKLEDDWSKILKIPPRQFTQPSFQKTAQKRSHPTDKQYHGVLRVCVRKSSLLLKKMRGWIQGLSDAPRKIPRANRI